MIKKACQQLINLFPKVRLSLPLVKTTLVMGSLIMTADQALAQESYRRGHHTYRHDHSAHRETTRRSWQPDYAREFTSLSPEQIRRYYNYRAQGNIDPRYFEHKYAVLASNSNRSGAVTGKNYVPGDEGGLTVAGRNLVEPSYIDRLTDEVTDNVQKVLGRVNNSVQSTGGKIRTVTSQVGDISRTVVEIAGEVFESAKNYESPKASSSDSASTKDAVVDSTRSQKGEAIAPQTETKKTSAESTPNTASDTVVASSNTNSNSDVAVPADRYEKVVLALLKKYPAKDTPEGKVLLGCLNRHDNYHDILEDFFETQINNETGPTFDAHYQALSENRPGIRPSTFDGARQYLDRVTSSTLKPYIGLLAHHRVAVKTENKIRQTGSDFEYWRGFVDIELMEFQPKPVERTLNPEELTMF